MRNEAKLKNLGLEKSVRYYYLKFGKEVATVCVIKTIPTYVRGVAYCNLNDQFVRKHGRAVALGRAVKAIETHQSTEPLSDTTHAVILKDMGWSYLSCWNPILTKYELLLFREAGVSLETKQAVLVNVPATKEKPPYSKPDVIEPSNHKPAHKLTSLQEEEIVKDYLNHVKGADTIARLNTSPGEYYRVLKRKAIRPNRIHPPAKLALEPTAPETVAATPPPSKPVKETVKPGIEKKGIDEKDVREVFAAIKERRGYNSPNPKAEAVAIRWMLGQNYPVDDILWTYDAMKQQGFWQAKFLSMQSVKSQIGELLKKRGKAGV